MADEKTIPEEQPLQGNESNTKFQEKTWHEKLCYLKSNISVEPVMAGLIIPSMLSKLAVQNLNLEKACRIKLQLGEEVCTSLIKRDGNFTQHENDIQVIIASIDLWKNIIQTSIPLFLVIFMGAWSDRTGNRKLCILLPILGELLTCISNIISAVFFEEIPIEVTMFFEALFPAITGGWVMMYLGVFSYISDITDSESRTFRMGLVNLCMTGGIPIGSALSGILLRLWGYYGVFTISGAIYLLDLSYAFFCLKSNTKPDNPEDEKVSTFFDVVHGKEV